MKNILLLLFLILCAPAWAQMNAPDSRPKAGQAAYGNKPNIFTNANSFINYTPATAATPNQPSPTLTIAGQGWGGSFSCNMLWTIQVLEQFGNNNALVIQAPAICGGLGNYVIFNGAQLVASEISDVNSFFIFDGSNVRMGDNVYMGWSNGTNWFSSATDTNISRKSAGIVAVGSSATIGDVTGQVQATKFLNASGINIAQAQQTISYQPGLLSAVNPTKAVFYKFVRASTVDNIEGSAATFSCVSNPTVTMFECGTSATCASSPTTIGTVTVTAAGTVVDGTISSSAIAAGDYVAFAITGGTCASIDIAVTSQVHNN